MLGEDELKEHAATVSRKFVEQNQEALAAKVIFALFVPYVALVFTCLARFVP